MLIHYVAEVYLISAALFLIYGIFNRSWAARLFGVPSSKLGSLAFYSLFGLIIGNAFLSPISGIRILNMPGYILIALMAYYWTRGIALMRAPVQPNRTATPCLDEVK